MTRDEAMPGAVVAKVNARGEKQPGLYKIRSTTERCATVERVGGYGRQDFFRLARLRLATPDERRAAGLEVDDGK